MKPYENAFIVIKAQQIAYLAKVIKYAMNANKIII